MEDKIIGITEEAKKHINSILKDNPDKVLRFGVSSGGCSGFTYIMDLVEKEECDNDELITENVFVDALSVFLVIGTTIGYNTDIMGSYFTFTNPNSVASCGCGTSFSA